MKPFDLEKAKAGAPICTKSGKDVRIICFDAKSAYPIIALISNNNIESINNYTINGKFSLNSNSSADLMMKDIHHEGWINIYKGKNHTECGGIIYNSKEDAKKYKYNNANYITTIKIEWDE